MDDTREIYEDTDTKVASSLDEIIASQDAAEAQGNTYRFETEEEKETPATPVNLVPNADAQRAQHERANRRYTFTANLTPRSFNASLQWPKTTREYTVNTPQDATWPDPALRHTWFNKVNDRQPTKDELGSYAMLLAAQMEFQINDTPTETEIRTHQTAWGHIWLVALQAMASQYRRNKHEEELTSLLQ